MPTQEQLTDTFHFALVSFLLQAKQNLISVASEFGLTNAQAFALLLIDQNQPRSMKSYSLTYDCDAANITGIIDGLESKQLVTRRQDPKDRRVKSIYIEPAGVKLRTELIRKLSHVNEELLSPLSTSERKVFATCIEKIAGRARLV